jgi:hypothetical protein
MDSSQSRSCWKIKIKIPSSKKTGRKGESVMDGEEEKMMTA